MAEQSWEERLEEARTAVRRGDFDEIKSALEKLEFTFRLTSRADHWIYFHTLLRSDPNYRNPTHLYRPHGRRRERGRVTRIDQQHAKRMIDALDAALGAASAPEEITDEQ